MTKKIRQLIKALPIILSFVGSILIAFSLRLVDPAGDQGSIEVFGKPLIIPEQNDTLFFIGIVLLTIGALWEIIKIINNK